MITTNSFLKSFTFFISIVWFVLAVLVEGHADYSTDFNSAAGYSIGPLADQNGWVNQFGTSFQVIANDGSTVSVNPNGGDQVVYSSATLTSVSRVMHPISVVGNILDISFDVNQRAATNVPISGAGLLTVVSDERSNIFSSASYQVVPGQWKLGFVGDAAGNPLVFPNLLFDLNTWYTINYQVDFSRGSILSATAQCIAGQSACDLWGWGTGVVNLLDQLDGILPIVRVGTPGEIWLAQNSLNFTSTAYDNINIVAVPEPGTYLSMAGFTALILAMAKQRKVRVLSVNNVK